MRDIRQAIEKATLEEMSKASLVKAVDYSNWILDELIKGGSGDLNEQFENTIELVVKHIGTDVWFLSQPLIKIVEDISKSMEQGIKTVFHKPLGIGESKEKIEFAKKVSHVLLIATLAKYVKEMLGDIEEYKTMGGKE